MPIDFSTLNLELIDTTTNLAPDIYINATSITFTKKVLDVLNYPQHVQFLTDPLQKVFAVRASRSDGKQAYSFSKPRDEQKQTVSIGNKNIFELVQKMMEDMFTLRPGVRFKVTGIMDDNKTMIFCLADAVENQFRASKEETAENDE
ncbi:hypothetical protein LJC07_05710 [Christensenellaceae bacterium OttesenSCG-928-L17]|nr:hypothetical protein [Christensenellaceae bacterium OttesenSCG-928-L17]